MVTSKPCALVQGGPTSCHAHDEMVDDVEMVLQHDSHLNDLSMSAQALFVLIYGLSLCGQGAVMVQAHLQVTTSTKQTPTVTTHTFLAR